MGFDANIVIHFECDRLWGVSAAFAFCLIGGIPVCAGLASFCLNSGIHNGVVLFNSYEYRIEYLDKSRDFRVRLRLNNIEIDFQ